MSTPIARTSGVAESTHRWIGDARGAPARPPGPLLPATATVTGVAQATVVQPSAVAARQAVPVSTTRRKGLTSPLRLRIWTGVVILGAVAVLAVTELGMTRVRSQVNVIALQAAPQAATASDLYFALSDLDAQLARLAMIGTSSTFASDRLDALLTYQRRSAEISADIDQATRAAAGDADRATIRQLLDQLGRYRELAWQALAIEGDATDQVAGELPGGALGYYGRATDLMHFQLLPTALRLRTSSRATLERAYTDQRNTGIVSVLLTVVLGGLLLFALVLFQLRLTRRYRRLVNPALLLATLATLGLVISASVVFLDETNRLGDAQRDSFGPYLALTQAQAVSYDAAADTSRYLISTNRAYFQEDYQAKSQCLSGGGTCGASGDLLPAGLTALAAGPGSSDTRAKEVVDRWSAYQRDHDKVVSLVSSGQIDAAVRTLTGIARGDAAFDFAYYDAAAATIAAGHRQAFEASVAGARGQLSGWTMIPLVLMVAVMLLALVGIRPRLAEYR
jgi:hypothetical protein